MIDVKKTGAEIIISEIELKGDYGFMVEINNVEEYRDVFNMLYAFMKELCNRTNIDISELCMNLEEFDAHISGSLKQKSYLKDDVKIEE